MIRLGDPQRTHRSMVTVAYTPRYSMEGTCIDGMYLACNV
eukprot:COSAG06_NODE_58490_length_277_cov_0.544944_1_plen_39_part_01